jgi:4-amino-4-deoxy-L-arabinose transferase-like glycosyltransferase
MTTALRASPGWLPSKGAMLLLLVLSGVALLLDPRRELLTWDDGWAYARSVATLLNQGRYTLDNWAAANMPVQIGLGALSSKIFGFSLTLLRLNTMAMLVVLALSFRHLAQATGSSPAEALVLSLALIASPVLLMLSFTFMSDVQLLAWLVLALALYQHGLKIGRAWPILAGSVAAACAIGTRQIGIAIFAGWLATLLFAARGQRPGPRTLALALALPVAMAAWQLWRGTGDPNFTQAYRIAEQHVLFAQPLGDLATEAIWRSAIWLQYSALYLLPVAPLVMTAGAGRFRNSSRRALRRGLLATTLLTTFVGLGLAMNSDLTVRPEPATGAWPWPALGLIWMIHVQPWSTPAVERLLDVAGFLDVVALSWLAFSRDRLLPECRPSTAMLLLIGTGVGLLVIAFPYVQLNDTYVVTLVPFALIAAAALLRDAEPRKTWLVATVIWSLLLIASVTYMTRRAFDAQQVAWDAAEQAAVGRSFACVDGPKHWSEYHGAFDDWIAAGAPGLRPAPSKLRIGEDPFHDPFYAWLDQRSHESAECP